MGASFVCLRPSSSRLSKVNSDYQNAGLSSSFSGLVKPGYLWTGGKEKKMEFLRHEKQQQLNKEERTLEEWLLASPGLNKNCYTNEGEYFVVKSLSQNVHLSLYGDGAESTSNSMDVLLKVDEVEQAEMIRRNQTGNTKKRVTFRLPEEADIFIFYSPAEETGE